MKNECDADPYSLVIGDGANDTLRGGAGNGKSRRWRDGGRIAFCMATNDAVFEMRKEMKNEFDAESLWCPEFAGKVMRMNRMNGDVASMQKTNGVKSRRWRDGGGNASSSTGGDAMFEIRRLA